MAEQSRRSNLSQTLANLHGNTFFNRMEMVTALNEFIKAHSYALDAKCDFWEFAVEIGTLRKYGLSDTDLRLLVLKELIEHRLDVTAPNGDVRKFERLSGARFYAQSCFILTPAGVAYARQLLGRREAEPGLLPLIYEQSIGNTGCIPHWDALRRQLRVDTFLVKHYRWPAPNQEMVLQAFQEVEWPQRIDDPLIPTEGQDSKQRLHDTIKCLNRRQKVHFLRFCGDGTGEGITWRYTRNACKVLGLPFSDDDHSQKCG